MIILRIGIIVFFLLLLIIILLMLNRRRVDNFLYRRELKQNELDRKAEIERLELLVAHEESLLETDVDKAEHEKRLTEIHQLKEEIKQIEER